MPVDGGWWRGECSRGDLKLGMALGGMTRLVLLSGVNSTDEELQVILHCFLVPKGTAGFLDLIRNFLAMP